MMGIDWQPLWLTFKLAGITTILLLLIGLPIAWWLANTRSRIKPVAEALISLPIILPPSVLGFYLLLSFSPNGFPGRFFSDYLDISLVFSFTGLVVGSIIYSLPFMVQPLQAGFEGLPGSLTEASYTLGRTRFQTLFRVLLPNIRPALLTGMVLSFAHTIGEFGLVLMIGGNIPGETRVVSIAIYHEVESLNYATAHLYSGILLVLAFTILLTIYLVNKRLVKTF
ncbi:MAG: modB [Adhaeribacter sp.]|nr:modB [Adhaeribacter sp.]